jgi:hypothetical protein
VPENTTLQPVYDSQPMHLRNGGLMMGLMPNFTAMRLGGAKRRAILIPQCSDRDQSIEQR